MIRSTLCAIGALMLVSATPAHATGGVYCDGATDKGVAAYLTVGRVPGMAVVNATIAGGGREFSIGGLNDMTPIAVAQAAVIGDLTVADFTDPNHENIVVSLRVVRADTEAGSAAAGVLSIPGVGVWPVVCEIE